MRKKSDIIKQATSKKRILIKFLFSFADPTKFFLHFKHFMGTAITQVKYLALRPISLATLIDNRFHVPSSNRFMETHCHIINVIADTMF